MISILFLLPAQHIRIDRHDRPSPVLLGHIRHLCQGAQSVVVVTGLNVANGDPLLGMDILKDRGRTQVRGTLVKRQRLPSLAQLVEGIAELQAEA